MLITVAVVTYNSSKTVVDTLESIRKQTYSDIELIISDDCSTDDTVAVINDWVAKNKDRFVGVELLTSAKNFGISANRNKCIRKSQGDWIKFVDGDDMLPPDSIEAYLRAMSGETHFIMGNFIGVNENGETRKFCIEEEFFRLEASEQLVLQKRKARILWPGVIHRRETLMHLGGLDERFPMLDDIPFFLKVLQAGYKFYSVDSFVFIYRMYDECAGSVQKSEAFHVSHVNYVNQILVPEYKKDKRYIDYWHDKWWSKKELAKLNHQYLKANLIYGLMLVSDCKEWYYIVRDRIYSPLVCKWRERKKNGKGK